MVRDVPEAGPGEEAEAAGVRPGADGDDLPLMRGRARSQRAGQEGVDQDIEARRSGVGSCSSRSPNQLLGRSRWHDMANLY